MSDNSCCKKTGVSAYILGVLGAFLIVGVLVGLMRNYTQPPSLASVRGEERTKIHQDFLAANNPIVTTYAWQDPSKDLVRVPVARAKELLLQEWQDPAKGRALLIQRAEKAFAPAAAAKSPYE